MSKLCGETKLPKRKGEYKRNKSLYVNGLRYHSAESALLTCESAIRKMNSSLQTPAPKRWQELEIVT